MTNNYIGLTTGGSRDRHLTVVYLGRKVPTIRTMLILQRYGHYKAKLGVKDIDKWNGNLVALLDVPESHWIRDMREELSNIGVTDNSKYEWNPHVTVRKERELKEGVRNLIQIPPTLILDAPYCEVDERRIYAAT